MHKSPLDISLTETTTLKGLALLLLLWHHLFYEQTGLYEDITIGEYGIINQTGIIAKVCVAIFVLLSGYGLTMQYQKKELRVKEFFKRRFVKLFTSFWLIWLIFVPIGFIFYGYTLEGVYGDHPIPKLIVQFFGMQHLIGIQGLNDTWWFYTCIILLYLCFPILNALNHVWLIIATGVSFLFIFSNIPGPGLIYLRPYLITFICGIWMARLNIKYQNTLPRFLNNLTLWVCLLIFLVFWRFNGIILRATFIDFAMAVAITMIFKTLPAIADWLMVTLVFIGRHSMNIFLFHTFIYYYYWPDLIFWSRNPFLIFLTLLIICLAVSIIIEQVKKWVPLLLSNNTRRVPA